MEWGCLDWRSHKKRVNGQSGRHSRCPGPAVVEWGQALSCAWSPQSLATTPPFICWGSSECKASSEHRESHARPHTRTRTRVGNRKNKSKSTSKAVGKDSGAAGQPWTSFGLLKLDGVPQSAGMQKCSSTPSRPPQARNTHTHTHKRWMR